MNTYYKGKTDVTINGKFVGLADGVTIDKTSNVGHKIVDITINEPTKDEKTDKIISPKENYDKFFQKFFKAFKD